MNKPVAWMNKIATSWVTTIPDDAENEWIPLYTHPVDAVNTSQEYVDKTQNNRHELTDEEIVGVFESPFNPNRNGTINSEVIAFARAILRKAQDK